jgi:hypothetical protein
MKLFMDIFIRENQKVKLSFGTCLRLDLRKVTRKFNQGTKRDEENVIDKRIVIL